MVCPQQLDRGAESAAQIALDAAGDLFVAEPYSSSVREVPAPDMSLRGKPLTAGAMYTVAGAPHRRPR